MPVLVLIYAYCIHAYFIMHTLTCLFSYYVLLKGSSLPPISAERHGKAENKKTARNEHELSIRDERKECDEKIKSEHKDTSQDEA